MCLLLEKCFHKSWGNPACAFILFFSPAVYISFLHHWCTTGTLLLPIKCHFLFMISAAPMGYLILGTRFTPICHTHTVRGDVTHSNWATVEHHTSWITLSHQGMWVEGGGGKERGVQQNNDSFIDELSGFKMANNGQLINDYWHFKWGRI